jgi:endonuclease YncB( thermonuclease family)
LNAKIELTKLLKSDGKVELIADPKLDNSDRYGRSLRYLLFKGVNVNLKMVEIGAAAPYFYRGDKGMYSKQLMNLAESAKKNKLGLWKYCPRTTLEPNRALSTK